MCGIIAVLRNRSARPVPQFAPLRDRLDEALARLELAVAGSGGRAWPAEEMTAVAGLLEAVDRELRGPPGVACLLAVAGGADQVADRGAAVAAVLDDFEERLDTGKVGSSPAQLEAVNAVVVRLRDVSWALGRDRPATARAVAALAGGATPGVIAREVFSRRARRVLVRAGRPFRA